PEIARFRQSILQRHNQFRARHGSPALAPDSDLDAYAQNWASHLAASSKFAHSSGPYGENLYYEESSSAIDAGEAAAGATESWYGESAGYRYGDGFSASTGHFTQVVWKDTARLGCGMA